MDTIVLNDRKYVLVPVEDYERLTARAAPPSLPPADKAGRRPAIEFAQASIARSIIEGREAAGLTQRQLADRAGIRVEVLNRAERGAVTPTVRTLERIEAALASARPVRGRRR